MNDLEMIKPEGVQGLIYKFCYVIGNIPTSYKLGVTIEEQILAIGEYLEKEIYPALNSNAEALAELQGLFVQLKNYVTNYFRDLDVETEINNKLDEMAENGTLEEIIAHYLTTSNIKVHFLYRGDNKGDCSLIQTKDNNILVDLGSTDSATLISKLYSLNITKIDYVIISHFHGDHCMGYTDGYDASNIQNLLDSEIVDFSECIFVLPKNPDWNNFIYSDTEDGTNRDSQGAGYVPALATNIATVITNNGNQIIRPDNTTLIEIDDKTKISFMNADQLDYDNYYDVVEYNSSLEKYVTDYNNFSLVAMLTHENHNFLFTGDIEKPAENHITPNLSYVDVLKVEHHAGNEEVDAEFYNKCSPKIAVIMSTGATGRNSDMINGLELFGTEIYSSNVSKDVVITSTTNFLFVESEKGKHIFNANILKANKMNNFAPVYPLSNDGIQLKEGTDLNDITTPGVYYCNSSSIAESLINCPIEAGFKLIVEYTQASNRIIQTIKANNTAHSTSFVRTYVDTWGAWNKVIKEQILFESTEGTNADITLSKPISVFDEIEIFYSVSGFNKSVRIPVRTTTNLKGILDFMYAGSQNVVAGTEGVTLNSTSLTRGTLQAKNINIENNTITTNSSVELLIHKVVAY